MRCRNGRKAGRLVPGTKGRETEREPGRKAVAKQHAVLRAGLRGLGFAFILHLYLILRAIELQPREGFNRRD